MSTVRPTDDEIERTVKSYSNTLFKLCFTILCNRAEAEDAVSDTFLKYIVKSPKFNDEEHEKAWLIKVAVNICKDKRRFNLKDESGNDVEKFKSVSVDYKNDDDKVIFSADRFESEMELSGEVIAEINGIQYSFTQIDGKLSADFKRRGAGGYANFVGGRRAFNGTKCL